jgi:chromosome segregation ATPase
MSDLIISTATITVSQTFVTLATDTVAAMRQTMTAAAAGGQAAIDLLSTRLQALRLEVRNQRELTWQASDKHLAERQAINLKRGEVHTQLVAATDQIGTINFEIKRLEDKLPSLNAQKDKLYQEREEQEDIFSWTNIKRIFRPGSRGYHVAAEQRRAIQAIEAELEKVTIEMAGLQAKKAQLELQRQALEAQANQLAEAEWRYSVIIADLAKLVADYEAFATMLGEFDRRLTQAGYNLSDLRASLEEKLVPLGGGTTAERLPAIQALEASIEYLRRQKVA